MCSSQGKFASPNFYYYYTRKLKASVRLTIPGEHPLTLDMCKDRCTVTGLWYHATQSRLRFLSLLIRSSNTTSADRQIVGNHTEIAVKKWWSHTAMRELTLLVVTCSLSDSRQFIRPRRIYQGPFIIIKQCHS